VNSVIYPVYAEQRFGSAVDLGLMYAALAVGALIANGAHFVLAPHLPRRAVLLQGTTAFIGSPGDAAARDPLLQEVAEAAQRAAEAGCGAEQPAHSRSSDSYLVSTTVADH
jgi:hypothetical protein